MKRKLILYTERVYQEGDILDLAAKEDIVNKSGAWYAYDGNKIGQGRENAKTYLKEHPDIMAEIEQKVREKFSKEIKSDEEESVFADETESTETPTDSIIEEKEN